jgi:hypothetical protein
MDRQQQPEVWLRGPIDGVPTELQPVAHALLQAVEDVAHALAGAPGGEVWSPVGGAATAGYHVLHMTGSLDRLLTYARGETLSDAQRAALADEQRVALSDEQRGQRQPPAALLLKRLRTQVDSALAQLRATDPAALDDARAVGRAGLPSSVRGLLHHAGEHTARHAGQVITTLKIARTLAGAGSGGSGGSGDDARVRGA